MFIPGAALARAHAKPLPRPAEMSEADILVRYDAKNEPDGPVVYAVIDCADLAKVPKDVLNGLDLAVRHDDGSFSAGKHSFFIRRETGNISLYVDEDAHPSFLQRLGKACRQNSGSIFIAAGDARNMIGPSGDIEPAPVTAHVANGFRRASVLEGLLAINEEREAIGNRRALAAVESPPADPFDAPFAPREPSPGDGF
ncbi:hypothetical protein ACEUZ9_002885 [Paracoccus litorisediminis]|uniref:hypothetical protein n=1 Tax=Paracoccus litorisediminis TaxID=2006130 RepID=UPI003732AA39